MQGTHNSHFILTASENSVCRSALNSFYMSSKDDTKKKKDKVNTRKENCKSVSFKNIDAEALNEVLAQEIQ